MKVLNLYRKAVDFIENLANIQAKGNYVLNNKDENIYIKRTRYLLNLIGNPDKSIRFIHIAGTAGKGTVTSMVHEILNTSGIKVGSFTSPFTTTSIEKIKLGNKYIDPFEFADIVEYLKPFIDKAYRTCPYGGPSYFEIFLAIALIAFERQKCEWVVLEVGLGGRYDATNVIEKPVITAITNIDFDHTEILGKTLQKIAWDKAGIIKTGSVFFTTEQRPQILKIFKKICKEKKVILKNIDKQSNFSLYNKELAIEISKKIGINDLNIDRGINKAKLPCRFEIMQNNPTVVLDGAHNRSKIRSTIYNISNIKYKKLHLVIGISNNKDHISILKEIIPLVDCVYFTRFQKKDRKCAAPSDLLNKSEIYLKKNTKTFVYLDPEMAINKALEISSQDDLVLVTGSFFLAGELRKRWFSEEWILKHKKSF